MKDIKSYVIGFLTCACLFLIMGQTENNVMKDIKTFITENGRYQIATSSSIKGGTAWWIHETIIDTRNGEVVGRDSYVQKHYNKHK